MLYSCSFICNLIGINLSKCDYLFNMLQYLDYLTFSPEIVSSFHRICHHFLIYLENVLTGATIQVDTAHFLDILIVIISSFI